MVVSVEAKVVDLVFDETVVDVEGVEEGGVESLAAANLWTSSLRTRPSLPLPVTWDMSTSSSFKRPRTAGVAKAACFPVGVFAADGSLTLSASLFWTTCSTAF